MERWTGVLSRRHSYRCPVMAFVSPPSWPPFPLRHGHRFSAGVATFPLRHGHRFAAGVAIVSPPSWPPLPTSGVSFRCRVVSRRFSSLCIVVLRFSPRFAFVVDVFVVFFSLFLGVFSFFSRSSPSNTKLSLAISSRHARRHGRVSGGCVNCFRSALVFWQKKRERPRYPSRGIHNLQTIGVLPRAGVVALPLIFVFHEGYP